ncbi:hypothetical protein FNV43_RR24976 [Rhamnella rubrinervis]|uniref:Protein kinase domain-containing protein n=1 Tax=Rhamnella rubrinervis TaxID=2594499 RepID=A0A8K0GR76_9ROSA|nr:hypothetical protein FNV43_RR24976 [Rhamnella rubrinervis]
MSCCSCCEEGDIHKAANNGPLMPHNSAAAPKETKTITIQPIAVSVKDITHNFGTKALIGGGSYGRVYYGVLKSGLAAAIKKLDSSKQPEQEFLAQISMVSRLKHENVVELVGYWVVPYLLKFLDNLTNIYVRFNCKRLKGRSGEEDCRAALSTLFNKQMLEIKEKADTQGPPMTIDEIVDVVLPPRSGYAHGHGPSPKPPAKAQRIVEEQLKMIESLIGG